MARLVLLLVGCLLAQAFAVPAGNRRHNSRPLRADAEAEVNFSASANVGQSTSSTSSYDIDEDDDEDDDFEDNMEVAPSTGGGSNIMSLLNLATALFPSASGGNFETTIRRLIRDYFVQNPIMLRRQDIADNIIEIDYINKLTPPFQRQETEENGDDTNESEDSNGDDSNGNDGDDDSELESKEIEDNDAAEESIEENANGNDKSSKQDSGLKDNDDSDYDSDEPPGGGDGQGGGILGLLAGLSGGEDGQSDLGSLLAAVSGIVGSLSGDGFDLNSLIATAFGLFVGLLSEGEENPGAVIASYLLTSLDTITGGGAENNGQYFGKFLSTLLKGSSATQGSSETSAQGAVEQLQSPLWALKMDILRAVLQFGTRILGLASTSFTRAVTV